MLRSPGPTQNGRAATHAHCRAEWDNWKGAVSSYWDLHMGGGLLLHDQPRKERGPGPDPWVSTPPCHLACQDLVFHNRYKLLSFCLYDFISPTMHPDSSVRPPNKPTRETMPLLSFASVALANLSV